MDNSTDSSGKAQHTLGNIVAGNKVVGNTQCMVMMGLLLRIEPMSIRSNIVAGPIMTIHWVFPATLFPATMLPSVCSTFVNKMLLMVWNTQENSQLQFCC